MTDFSSRTRTEKIQRAALLILFNELNDKIDELEEEWNSADQDFYAAMDKVDPGFYVEHIPSDNFHAGTRTNILSKPRDYYPNVCCIAYTASPLGTSDDFGEGYFVNLLVEVMVKADSGEQETNSRLMKTKEAISEVFKANFSNRTLGNLVPDIGVPAETTGDVFTTKKDNKTWYWQGGTLTYSVYKYVDNTN